MDKIKVITILDDEQYLRQISVEVNLDDSNLKNDIAIVEEFCKENEVCAMAAVQLGIPKRIVYLKNTNLEIIKKAQTDSITEEEKAYNEARILINPVIISKEGLTDYWESCASCLDNFGHVRRPYKIVVEYYDINGEKHFEAFEEFGSTVLSHEMDHLDGVLHTDIADELLIMAEKERKIFRQTHGYNIISMTGKYEDLLKSIEKS